MFLATLYHPDGRVFVLPPAYNSVVTPGSTKRSWVDLDSKQWQGIIEFRCPCYHLELTVIPVPRTRYIWPPIDITYRVVVLLTGMDGEAEDSMIVPDAVLEACWEEEDQGWYKLRFMIQPKPVEATDVALAARSSGSKDITRSPG